MLPHEGTWVDDSRMIIEKMHLLSDRSKESSMEVALELNCSLESMEVAVQFGSTSILR